MSNRRVIVFLLKPAIWATTYVCRRACCAGVATRLTADMVKRKYSALHITIMLKLLLVHAALLPELAALGDVLARQPQWMDDLRAVRARQLRILQVCTAPMQSRKCCVRRRPISEHSRLGTWLQRQPGTIGVSYNTVSRSSPKLCSY